MLRSQTATVGAAVALPQPKRTALGSIENVLRDRHRVDPGQLAVGAEQPLVPAEDEHLVEALAVAGSATLSIFSSTEVRQPPQGGVSMLATTWPVPRIIFPGPSNFITVTGSPTGQMTCGETPTSDSLWLRRITGSAGWSKPRSRLADVQWAPISVPLTVFGAGSCMNPGRSNSNEHSRSEMPAFQSHSQMPTVPG